MKRVMMKKCVRAGWRGLLLGLLGLATGVGALAQSVTANWVGGNLYKRWDDPANWDKGYVPFNGNGTNYTVMVPSGASISYLSDLTGSIEGFSFEDGGVLDIAEDSKLEVTGEAVIR
ncbi:MAG TPA: hypothetical protein P5525_10455, partial [Candidatus Paceibacterota bacterium]|nr:hypothetical protein [Candidatus Paceibacterota bacterium]